MKSRVGKALAALLMISFFSLTCIVVVFLMPWLILHWLWRGLDSDEDYIYRVGKALDQVTNAATFAGHPGETTSSHVGRWVKSGKPMPWWATVINWITDKADTNHCIDSIEEQFFNEPL